MSTFQGLELARKALFAQQGALYTTGHNIANVNTEGYSRQRVNFESTTPFPVPSRVMPQIPGQIGRASCRERLPRAVRHAALRRATPAHWPADAAAHPRAAAPHR